MDSSSDYQDSNNESLPQQQPNPGDQEDELIHEEVVLTPEGKDTEDSLEHVVAVNNGTTTEPDLSSGSRNASDDEEDNNRDDFVQSADTNQHDTDNEEQQDTEGDNIDAILENRDQVLSRISPLYLKVESKRLFYSSVLPKQRYLSLFLTYALCALHAFSVLGAILFGHPVTIMLSAVQLISLAFNVTCIIMYHRKGTSEFLEQNISYMAAQCMFNVFVGGLSIFMNAIITTLVLISLTDFAESNYSCFLFCTMSAFGMPLWLWGIFAFMNNIVIYLGSIASFSQGYAAGMFVAYKESKDMLPVVDKYGIPSLNTQATYKTRSRIIRLQRFTFALNVGLSLCQVLMIGFTLGMILILIFWNENAALIFFYSVAAFGNVISTLVSSTTALIQRHQYWRKLSIALNVMQAVAVLFAVWYVLMVFLSIEAQKDNFSSFTFLLIGCYGVLNVIKTGANFLAFVLGIVLTVIRVRMPHIARVAYYSTPTWRKAAKRNMEARMFGKGVREAPEYDDLMYEEFHQRMEHGEMGDSNDELLHEDTIELNVSGASADGEDAGEIEGSDDDEAPLADASSAV